MAAKKAREPKLTTSQWWRAKELGWEPHQVLNSIVDRIQQDQSGRYMKYQQYARAMGQDPTAFGEILSDIEMDGSDLTINEMAATVETIHAQIFRNRVVPGIVANDASNEEYERAKKLSRFVDGVFSDAKVHQSAVPQCGLDALVFGTGVFKVSSRPSEDGYEIVVERVCPMFVYVDRVEARHGKPRSFYQKSHVDRFVLYDLYGDEDDTLYGKVDGRRAAINTVSAGDDKFTNLDLNQDTDMVTVWESWHLPSGPKSKDGRHCIWIKGCTLVDEPWESGRLPFTLMPFGTQLAGVWGRSAVKELLPAQRAHDKMSRRIDLACDLAVPRLLVRRGSGVNVSHIDDVEGAILEIDDINGVREWNAAPIHSDQYRERDGLVSRMRSRFGVSQFEAQNELPRQMREASGTAMETWQDAGSARQALFHRAYEAAMEDLADLIVDECLRLQKAGLDVTALSPGGGYRTVERLNFKDVSLDRKKFKIQVQPISHLKRTFSGRVNDLEGLLNRGLISPKAYLRMLEVPDLDSEADLLTSSEDIIRKNLSHMARKKEYLPPLQFDDLATIVRLTTDYINEYRLRDDADEEVIAILARYIDDALALDALKKPPAPPPGAMPPPGPMPPEMAPPGPPGAPPGPPGPPPPMPPGMPDQGVQMPPMPSPGMPM